MKPKPLSKNQKRKSERNRVFLWTTYPEGDITQDSRGTRYKRDGRGTITRI